MTNEMLKLKNDVLNELRNEKYYIQEELKFIVDNTTISHKTKVDKVIDVTSKLVGLDAKIATVDAIFQIDVPTQESAPEEESDKPTNIVEPLTNLNAQGQTHAE